MLLLRYYSHFQEVIFAPTLSSVGFAGVTKADVQNMLDGGTGGLLDLGLLGVIGRDHGTITLEGVQVSDLSVNDFIIG